MSKENKPLKQQASENYGKLTGEKTEIFGLFHFRNGDEISKSNIVAKSTEQAKHVFAFLKDRTWRQLKIEGWECQHVFNFKQKGALIEKI